ncbi:hypothetical protein [Streptomyces griseofuscus]
MRRRGRQLRDPGVESIGDARRRVLLRSFAQDQVERHGCSGLRLTG